MATRIISNVLFSRYSHHQVQLQTCISRCRTNVLNNNKTSQVQSRSLNKKKTTNKIGKPLYQNVPSISTNNYINILHKSSNVASSSTSSTSVATEKALNSTTTNDHYITVGPYGIKRLDYTKVIPPRWPLPPHPPPRKNLIRRYFGTVLAGAFVCLGVYIVINRDDSVYEYWKRVEQGDVPIGDDDEEEEDDKDDDDWETFDEDQDEWEELSKKTKQ